ncbi:MAG: glycosyltransferase family 39 protein, partial [Planctomycetia bacterium]
MAPRLPPRAVLNLLFAGFTLRWMGLDRFGLWLDEGATWSWASKPTWGATALSEANHPPLWWLVTRAFTSWLGDSEEVLRLPAALASVLTIWLAWCLGRRLFMPSHAPRRGGLLPPGDDASGQRRATWFTGFIAASAFLIDLGQEARMYALLVAESLCLVLLWLRWLDRGGRGTLLAYALLAAASLYTHYFALWPLLAIAAHAAWLAWRTRTAPEAQRVPLRPVLLAHVAAALLFAPWVAYLLGHYEGMHRATHSALGALAVLAWRVGIGPALVAFDAQRAGQGLSEVWAVDGAWVATSVLLWLPLVLAGAWSLRRQPGLGARGACMLLVPVLGT